MITFIKILSVVLIVAMLIDIYVELKSIMKMKETKAKEKIEYLDTTILQFDNLIKKLKNIYGKKRINTRITIEDKYSAIIVHMVDRNENETVFKDIIDIHCFDNDAVTITMLYQEAIAELEKFITEKGDKNE